MRVNVYHEELTTEVQVVEKEVVDLASSTTFYGVRIFLKSPPDLHHSTVDDDRSAVTIWGPKHKLREIAANIVTELNK